MSEVVSPFQRSEEDALWSYLNDMAAELRTLKETLRTQNHVPKRDIYQSDTYFSFVTTLRERMQANTKKKHYPTIDIEGMKLGIDFKGLLYDKHTNRNLPRELAFEVYHTLYDKHLVKPFLN